MRRKSAATLGRAGLIALLAAVAPPTTRAADSACSPLRFEDNDYSICRFDARHDDIRLFWKDPAGKPYANFTTLAQTLKGRGRALRFAMNAVMFETDLSPVGLFIENGRRMRPADTRSGESNFHLKPNGVFWIGESSAGVTETSRYLANPPAARFATQSGPMLVIDGRIHPKILPTGTSEKVRNGVCVRDGATATFAISETSVTFNAFARLFRDGLGCSNALFLDGSVSSLYAPDIGRDDEFSPLGPIVGVTAPAP
ncbi:MAG: phosphodiester glycosidase family protein [Hyphomicrobiales bacterium]|nr:phosphodiester glycosidase family protein [Hyphomicrobiales bacterium]